MHPAARQGLDEYATHLLAAAFGPTPRKRYEAGLHKSGQVANDFLLMYQQPFAFPTTTVARGKGRRHREFERLPTRRLLQGGRWERRIQDPEPEAASEQSDLLPDCSSLT